VDEFQRRRSSFSARYPRRWRRLEAPRVNSVNGEVEDGDGDLLSTLEEQGAARNGGARPRALATISSRERETNGEEGEGQPGDRKKGRRGRRGVPGHLQGSSSSARGSRRWRWGHLEPPRSSSVTQRRKDTFAKSPFGFGVFSGNLKQSYF
jgi:hypothetical protein